MDKLKQKLDEELNTIQFSSNQQVLDKVKKKSMYQYGKDFLNKELEIPLVPITGISLAVIAIISISPILNEFDKNTPVPAEDNSVKDTVVEKGGSIYWESWFNEVGNDDS